MTSEEEKTDWKEIMKNTVRKGHCPACGNPWWIEKYDYYTCTTCGKKIPTRVLGSAILDRDFSITISGELHELPLPEKFAIYGIGPIFVNNRQLRTKASGQFAEYMVQSTHLVVFKKGLYPPYRIVKDGFFTRLYNFLCGRGYGPTVTPLVYNVVVLGGDGVHE